MVFQNKTLLSWLLNRAHQARVVCPALISLYALEARSQESFVEAAYQMLSDAQIGCCSDVEWRRRVTPEEHEIAVVEGNYQQSIHGLVFNKARMGLSLTDIASETNLCREVVRRIASEAEVEFPAETDAVPAPTPAPLVRSRPVPAVANNGHPIEPSQPRQRRPKRRSQPVAVSTVSPRAGHAPIGPQALLLALLAPFLPGLKVTRVSAEE